MEPRYGTAGTSLAAEPQAPTGTLQALQQRLEGIARRTLSLSELAANVRGTIVGHRPQPGNERTPTPRAVASGFIEAADGVMEGLTQALNSIENDLQELRDKL
jgi:hypothetical protein